MSMAPLSVTVSAGVGTPVGTAPLLTQSEAESLLRRYRTGIFAFLRRKGFSAEESDDLTQETLIRAYLHLSGFRGTSLDAWLYRIAANVAVDYLRKRKLTTVPLESIPQVEWSGDDPIIHLDRDERRAQVLSIINQLPECHQRILRLRYYEDRSLAEIAGVMNCTTLAAKLRVFRAVTALRKRWHTLPPDSEMAAG
jgi:RNA polymerase sigma-70 factor, ECF subfamily